MSKIYKVLAEFMYLFFMCCNLISVIGFSVKLANNQNVPMTNQWIFASFALLTGIAFLWMLKMYLTEHDFNKFNPTTNT